MRHPADFPPPANPAPPVPAWVALRSWMSIRRFYGLLIVAWSLRCALTTGEFIDQHPSDGAFVMFLGWAVITLALLVMMPFTRWLISHWGRDQLRSV